MILIICMKSWGEFGNYLAAQQLHKVVSNAYSGSAEIICADDYVDFFLETGKKIKAAVKQANNPDEVHRNYLSVVEDLHHKVEKIDNPSTSAIFFDLFKKIDEFNADSIVCTKGVIAKILATSDLSNNINLINYVTNHGHFTMNVHRYLEKRPLKYITRIPCAKEFIHNSLGVPKNSIYDMGYISSINNSDDFSSGEISLTDIIIVSNRGGRAYSNLFENLLRETNLKLHYIIINDETEMTYAKGLAGDQSERTTILDGFDQEAFLKFVSEVGKKGSIYVGKGSINTLIEAVIRHQPVLGLRSGLPMEEWGGLYLKEHNIGFIDSNWEVVSEKIVQLSKKPDEYKKLRININEYLHSDNINLDICADRLVKFITEKYLDKYIQESLKEFSDCISKRGVQVTKSSYEFMSFFLKSQVDERIIVNPDDLIRHLEKLNIKKLADHYIENFGITRMTINRTVRFLSTLHDHWLVVKQQGSKTC